MSHECGKITVHVYEILKRIFEPLISIDQGKLLTNHK